MEEKRLNGLRPLGSRTIKNPVAFASARGLTPPAAQPDPYVMKFNGEYYAYATGKTVPVFHSDDLARWTYEGTALDAPGQMDYWAPCVYYEGGKFYMYYSSWQEDLPTQALKVAVSNSPLGPFRYVKTFFDIFSIDAHVARDSAGDLYLFYMLDDYNSPEVEYCGTAIMCDRLLDPLTPEGRSVAILNPSMPEEVFQFNRGGDGRDWHTIEGPLYFEKGDTCYLFYSGAAFWFETYFTNYARLPLSQPPRSTAWRKYPDEHTYAPLMRMNRFVEGVGHNSIAAAPNLVDQWIVYHGRDVEQPGQPVEGEKRVMRLDPIYWLGREMWVPGPSHEAQDAPAMPAERDLFHGEGALSEAWTVVAGDWEKAQGRAVAKPAHIAALAVGRETYSGLEAEVSVRFEEMRGARRAGRRVSG